MNLSSKAVYHFACRSRPSGIYHQEMRPGLQKLHVLQTFLANLFVNVSAIVRVTFCKKCYSLSFCLHLSVPKLKNAQL